MEKEEGTLADVTRTQLVLRSEGYENLRFLPWVGHCGIMRMIYTTGLFVGLSENDITGRYCFNTRKEAEDSLNAWDGVGDPPGNWIKYKGRPEERSNPNYIPTE